VGFLPIGYTTAVWMGYDNPPGEPTRYMTSVHGVTVFGGTFPATIWRKYMSAAETGAPGAFVDPGALPGKVLNPGLTTTSSTVETSSTTSSTTTLPGGSSTTTTAPPDTTTTGPPETTTTTTPETTTTKKPIVN
jgi:membrane peptidoglycan carboxypeptidase